MSGTVHVKGLDELQKYMEQLVPKLEANVLRGALRAGANVVAREIKARAPSSPPSGQNKRLYGGYEGALRDSVRVNTRLVGSTVTATLTVGGKYGSADAYYARWVEFGTAAHRIVADKGALAFGGLFAKSLEHPGARPHPFVRVSMDSRASAAVVAIGEAVKARLSTKYGIDTADVEVQAL